MPEEEEVSILGIFEFEQELEDVDREAHSQRCRTVRVVPAMRRAHAHFRRVAGGHNRIGVAADTGDISPMLLSYTIEFQYKQFKWRLLKKASQVLYLHFALKKRAIIEEFHEKQEQVKEWLHSIGIADQTAVVQDDDEPDDGAVLLRPYLIKSKCSIISINSRAALRESMAFWKEKLGHTTIDLGIAPEKLESWENGEVKETDPMERLKCVRGHLVSFPLEFMNQEDLRPVFNESEFYTSPQVFM